MTTHWPLNTFEVKYRGIFDFDALYDFIYKWLQDRKYRTQEKKYKNKPDSPWGYEHELKIEGSHKVDAYFKYDIDIIFHIRDAAEIQLHGKRLYSGRFRFILTGDIITDYYGRFEANKFTKILEKAYNWMIRREIELMHWDVMHYRLLDFQEELKQKLNMYAKENYFKL